MASESVSRFHQIPEVLWERIDGVIPRVAQVGVIAYLGPKAKRQDHKALLTRRPLWPA